MKTIFFSDAYKKIISDKILSLTSRTTGEGIPYKIGNAIKWKQKQHSEERLQEAIDKFVNSIVEKIEEDNAAMVPDSLCIVADNTLARTLEVGFYGWVEVVK